MDKRSEEVWKQIQGMARKLKELGFPHASINLGWNGTDAEMQMVSEAAQRQVDRFLHLEDPPYVSESVDASIDGTIVAIRRSRPATFRDAGLIKAFKRSVAGDRFLTREEAERELLPYATPEEVQG